MKKKFWKPTVLLPCCYLLAALVYLAVCLFGFMRVNRHVQAGEMPHRPLELGDFMLDGVLPLADEEGKQRFASTDPDPKLIYALGVPFYAGRVVFAAQPHKPGGEIVLYYATNDDFLQTGFNENNKIWAKQTPGGQWYFDLDGKQVYALRLDPDTTGGILWTVQSIELNAPKPAAAYFVPDAFGWFWLLGAPPLAAALLTFLRQLIFCPS